MGKIEGQPVPPRPLCDLTARTGGRWSIHSGYSSHVHGGVVDNKTISKWAICCSIQEARGEADVFHEEAGGVKACLTRYPKYFVRRSW
jgi:hypothetical protein